MFLHMSVILFMGGGGGGGGIPACIAGGIQACLAAGLRGGGGIPACLAAGLQGGLQAHTEGGGVSRPTLVCVCVCVCIPACTEADPLPWTATTAGFTHPTGMHSCYFLRLVTKINVCITSRFSLGVLNRL